MREPEYVTGVNNATRTLSTLTIREPVERALDLGTGCGVQALLAARHADTSSRPTSTRARSSYARLNVAAERRRARRPRGSLFEPVAGETFDLIVVEPAVRDLARHRAIIFRDSGLGGDAVSRDVVRGAAGPPRARAGTRRALQLDLPQPGGRLAAARASGSRAAAATRSCSRTSRSSRSTTRRAGTSRSAATQKPSAARSTAGSSTTSEKAWPAIGIGAVVLRRRDGDNLRRGFDLASPATGRAGSHLLRLFAALDVPLEDDASLLDGRYRLVPGHRLDQSLRYERDGYTVAGVRITLDDGIGLVARIEPTLLPLLFTLDPQRTLRHAVAEADVDPEQAAKAIRRLHEAGFVEPA